jgi:uncharacterized damage-inducible protein DinB
MTDHFVRLFTYNDWANHRLLETLDRTRLSDSRALTLLSHAVVAQQLWLDRIRNSRRDYKLWDPIPIPELAGLSARSTFDWTAFIRTVPHGGWNRIVKYTNIKGIAYQNTIEDILIHVVNHGTHHRAQVSQLLRLAKIDPPVLDLISFARNEP